MQKLLTAICMVLTMLAAGCNCEQVDSLPVEPLCGVELSKEHAMQVAEDVLVGMHFEIDKLDVERGVLTTRPLRGAQFFEFWRSDNANACSWAESNLHSIVRRVSLGFDESPGGICIDSEVEQQRLVISDRPIPSISRLAGLYTGGNERLQMLSVEADNVAWESLPDDNALAKDVLDRIQQKILELKGKSE